MSESNSCPGDPVVQIEELNKKMITAAGSGDHEGVLSALGDGAKITYRDRWGDTGLHIGAYKGHDNVVKIFLENEIDVNIRDEGDTKWTALINAAYYGKLSCLKILLENEADPDIKDEKNGQTALMYAAMKNNIDIVSELLMKGADDKILNNAQKSALHLAREENNEDVVKFLETLGDQEALNKGMLTAASKGRGRLVIGFLRAGADLQATDEEGRTGLSLLNIGLFVAAKEGSAENINAFIEAGANVEARDEGGETGLDIAVKRGHRAVAEAFLDHGITGYNREECLQQCDNNRARINELNKKMISAARSGDNQGVEAALEEGAEITTKDSHDETGLHLSAEHGHQSVVLTLLTQGLDANIKGSGQRTALMMAAQFGHLPCVQTLLDHGALTDLQDKWGDTALMLAAKYDPLDVVAGRCQYCK